MDGMTNNPKLVNPPINPPDLKSQVETDASLSRADGGNKAITERDKERAVVVKMLCQLGHWVEANCNGDAAILQSSGLRRTWSSIFENRAREGPPPKPISKT